MFKFQKLPQMRVVVPLRLGSQYISVVFDVVFHVFRSFFHINQIDGTSLFAALDPFFRWPVDFPQCVSWGLVMSG